MGEVWSLYLEERRPHWGELHYRSHLEKASPGGQLSKRRGMTDRLTKPGPLAPLLALPLKDLDAATIEQWAAKEGRDRPSSARLAHRLLTVFLNWCAEQPPYADLLPGSNPAKTKRTREALGKQGVKDDVLTREQLPAWFKAVQQIQNPVISAALQVMLLTGARPDEVLDQKRRTRKAAARGTDAPEGDVLETSETGRITKPNTPHTRACAVAGIGGLTLHGLRRSFASLTEWLEIPAGVVAQIQGHKPSATAEKHYKRRPLDLLRLHHERIEAWMPAQAGVGVPSASAASTRLRAVQ